MVRNSPRSTAPWLIRIASSTLYPVYDMIATMVFTPHGSSSLLMYFKYRDLRRGTWP